MVESEFPNRAYFGDTHVHTGWSADAGLDGAVLGPEEAFCFKRGDEVKPNSGQIPSNNSGGGRARGGGAQT
ncbi:DUF3604 domain-containing protein [Candidatus Phycosocius spiralis]|uniref:DUF3604 domain-containing protein n=1 Tax=Candidatus Phycosocius spiralis TaxID=2815099 RepID=UPI003B9681C0